MKIAVVLVLGTALIAAVNGTSPDRPPRCGENEEYDSCGTACPLTCDNYEDPPTSCTDNCVIGCRCKEGFVLNDLRKCVKPEHCRPQCGKNEEYDKCGTACPLTCDNYKNPPKSCTYNCVIGCRCRRGFVLNDRKQCVKPRDCRPQCGKNEVYDKCGTACPLTCKNYNNPPTGCTKNCVIGCRCRRGFVLNDRKQCVRPEECQPQCGKNEVYDKCGTACPLTCKNYNNPPKGCTKNCVIGCRCRHGFVLNDRKQCVRPEECQPQCGKNEVFDKCGTACPLTCKNHKNPPKGCTRNCVIGCRCRQGFVLNDRKQCVRPEDCQPQCGKNEVYDKCGTACPLTCKNYKNPPKGCTRNCVIGCRCRQGFVLNDRKQCVRPEECQPQCGKNERYNRCGTVCPLTCENYKNAPLPCTKNCRSGCECKPGYVRDARGRCIKPEQCPSCPRNEKFNRCGTACPLTCANHKNPPKICTKNCVTGCQCKAGYVRSAQGRCVRPHHCPPCGKNQVYECRRIFSRNCRLHGHSSPRCRRRCRYGCYCKPGYVRNKKKVCVRKRKTLHDGDDDGDGDDHLSVFGDDSDEDEDFFDEDWDEEDGDCNEEDEDLDDDSDVDDDHSHGH